MRGISGFLLVVGMAAMTWVQGQVQTVTSPATIARDHAAAQPMGSAADTKSDKQKELATQADRLFDMAIELKAQVDLTNKNILSLKVVQKAAEIEALAKAMRQGRK